MKNWNIILGVDVSKLTLDVCWAERKLHIKIDNNNKGFGVFKKWCKTNQIKPEETLVVMEYTGGYEYRFVQFCESWNIAYCRVPGLEIKQSMGMTRGKSDRADAYRIGQYGEEKGRRLEPSRPLNNNILKLRQLLSFRKRLIRETAGLACTIKERQHMYGVGETDTIILVGRAKIKENKKHIARMEDELADLIKNDESMLQNYRIISSIKGIGPVNAWMTIAYTENFTSFTDARKYAVYVGVIPFEYTSGSSIKGRKRL